MVGISEVLQTMAAMIIFSLILLNANRMIHRNTIMQVEGELEQEVVAIAQDIIDEARTKDFDEETLGSGANALPAAIPEDFTDPGSLGPESGEAERYEFDDFDDYNGWSDSLETEHGWFYIDTYVFYADPSTYDSTNVETTYKKMKVYIRSKFLKNNDGTKTKYYLRFLRNYYAD